MPPLPPLNPALPKWVFGSLTQELIDSLTQKFDQEVIGSLTQEFLISGRNLPKGGKIRIPSFYFSASSRSDISSVSNALSISSLRASS